MKEYSKLISPWLHSPLRLTSHLRNQHKYYQAMSWNVSPSVLRRHKHHNTPQVRNGRHGNVQNLQACQSSSHRTEALTCRNKDINDAAHPDREKWVKNLSPTESSPNQRRMCLPKDWTDTGSRSYISNVSHQKTTSWQTRREKNYSWRLSIGTWFWFWSVDLAGAKSIPLQLHCCGNEGPGITQMRPEHHHLASRQREIIRTQQIKSHQSICSVYTVQYKHLWDFEARSYLKLQKESYRISAKTGKGHSHWQAIILQTVPRGCHLM